MEVCLSRSVAGRRVAASGLSSRVGLRWPRGTGRARLPAGNVRAALHGAQAGAAMTGRGCRERQEGQAWGPRAYRLMRRLLRRTLRVRSPCVNRVSIDEPL